METQSLAEIATIVGAVSILLTLVFVIIELKNNVAQAKVANIATRDQQIGKYMRYWLQDENFALVQKGQDDYHSLNETEKQKFEYYVDERIRMFSFSLAQADYLQHLNFTTIELKRSLNIKAVLNATSIYSLKTLYRMHGKHIFKQR